jgi:hypothetical protein
MSTAQTDDKQMVANVFPKSAAKVSVVFLACLMLAGCGGGGFDVKGILESRPVRLDGEQVVLDQEQLDCGTHEELWNVSTLGDTRSVGRLTQKGRDLHFGDDIQIGDPVVGVPYAQLHGSFSLSVYRPGSIRDEDEWDKVADARVGVKIDHRCFQSNPPRLMGIRHGQFDLSVNPVFRFKLDQEWKVDQVVH